MGLRSIPGLVFLLALGGVLPAWGQLEFAGTERSAELPLGAESLTEIFPFRNSGDRTIRILSVSSDCGCTAAKPAQTTYEPGEEGEIAVTFNVGNFSGERVQRVFLVSDDPTQPRQTLTLRISIPSEITIAPRVLQWRQGESVDWQEILLTVHPDSPVRLADVRSDDENVTLRWEKVSSEEEKGLTFRIQVKPDGARELQRFRIEFLLEPKDHPAAQRSWNAFGIVRR